MKVKIYYHHTDCGGVVYYANYLNFLEEARTEFLEKRGISIKESAGKGTQFVVSHQEIDYKLPAYYGDTLKIVASLLRVTGIKMEFEYEVRNQDDQTICTARTVMACVGDDFKPKSIPIEIRKKII